VFVFPAHTSSVVLTCNTYTIDADKGEKAIAVTGRGGRQDCETSRLPHFLDNRLTDGGEVSLTRQAIPVTGRGGP
jgi:hypothetical protein